MTCSDGGGGLAGRTSYENNNEEERKSFDRIRKSLIDFPDFNLDKNNVTPPTANAANKLFQTPATNTVAGYSNINRMDTSSSKGAQQIEEFLAGVLGTGLAKESVKVGSLHTRNSSSQEAGFYIARHELKAIPMFTRAAF
jgi:hypothetical protein